MVHIYGIKNCGTIKKTLNWFDENNFSYTFHDYKKEPATEDLISNWHSQTDWQEFVNKRGMTWRKMSQEEKDKVIDAQSAIEAMLANNSLIKRPVISHKDGIVVGFNEEQLATLFL